MKSWAFLLLYFTDGTVEVSDNGSLFFDDRDFEEEERLIEEEVEECVADMLDFVEHVVRPGDVTWNIEDEDEDKFEF